MKVDSASERRWPTLDELIEAYELAQVRDGCADPRAFLPPAEHPQYLAIACELVRVDLEYSWERGRPTGLDYYEKLFPELFRDEQCMQEISFEEYRLRQLAGERSSADEIRSSLRAEPLDACSRTHAGLRVSVRGAGTARGRMEPEENGAWDNDPLARAAAAYRAYHSGLANGDGADLHASFLAFRVDHDAASAYSELHRSSPPAAKRLAHAMTALPRVGSRFLGFELTQELGRGAFGRVYLARQGDLANRLVALKVSADVAGETRALAQLQHTNVVPIYSVHRSGPLQAVCMPFLGSTTLASVLVDLKRQSSLPNSGAALLSSLHTSRIFAVGSQKTPAASRAKDPAQAEGTGSSAQNLAMPIADERAPNQIERLRGLGYVQAVLWLIARVADGLAHAHERGILHRDLKPANILFADDGEPLLLDFNLAADTKTSVHAAAALIGGTLPYMAPEHLGAFLNRVEPVDARSDLYALGIILYELLTGRLPYAIYQGQLEGILPKMIADRQGPRPELRRWNPAATPAVQSIVERCLDPNPARRYQTARELQEDLQRQLDHRPLLHAPERSVRERAAKWTRRHPRLTSATSVALISGVLLCGVAASLWTRHQHVVRLEAASALHQISEARREAQFLLNDPDARPEQFDDGIALCRRALARFRVTDAQPWLAGPLPRALAPHELAQLRNDAGQLLLLWARAEAWQAEGVREPARRADLLQNAERRLELAESCLGHEASRLPLRLVRADVARVAGREADVRRLLREVEATPVSSASDRLWLVTDRLDHGLTKDAMQYIRDVSTSNPQDASTWLLLGNVYSRLNRKDEAAECYTLGITLKPALYWSHLNRGMLFLELKDFDRAHADFAQVVRLRPDLLAAYINRAQARLGLRDWSGAEADLTHVLKSNPKGGYSFALALRSKARLGRGDSAGAQLDRDELLKRAPDDEFGWIMRGLARLPANPQGALADFDAALKINPRSWMALQNKASVLSESLGRTEDAVAVLDDELKYHPTSVAGLAGRAVLLARLGRREAAHKDAQAVLQLDSGADTIYRVACVYALTSKQAPDDAAEAMRLLADAVRKDTAWLAIIPVDPDLNAIRNEPRYREMVSAFSLIWPR